VENRGKKRGGGGGSNEEEKGNITLKKGIGKVSWKKGKRKEHYLDGSP